MTSADDGGTAIGRADQALRSGDVDAAVAHLSAAVRWFASAGDIRAGAMACARLGDVLANAMGNITASRAWFARARRLLADEPACVEQGWVAVAAMGCDVDDPTELLAAAELALDRARRFDDVNLETKALADAGLAQVQIGRVAEGMALLEEAMALACGPADDDETAGKSVCSFFTACYYTADFGRAASWATLLRRRGLIGLAPGPPVFLSGHCDSVAAALLIELGRWSDAEAVLVRAAKDFESAMHSPSWHPAIALAALRIRQGRLSDAESLLLGKDQVVDALVPAARLQLARGDGALAAAMARRGLRAIGDDRIRAVDLLAVAVDAALLAGDLQAAADCCAELDARVGDIDVPLLQARAAAVRARALAAAGAAADAERELTAAAERIAPSTLPWPRASLLLQLARLHDAMGDRDAAALEAATAAAIVGALDVVLDPADAELLWRLGSRPAGPVTCATLSRSGTAWQVECAGSIARVPDSKGLRYVAELVRCAGAERHVLDLVDCVEGPAPPTGPRRRALGDAGPALDGRARAAYRARIEQLRAEADDALEAGLLETAEATQTELDRLVGQLAEAFGLGGRDRRAASAAERARLNVTRAIRAAIANLGSVLPGPAAVLDRRVRTGRYCAYQPADDDGVRWIVQS